VQRSPALLAALAKSAGGTEACRKTIFADRDDPDFKKVAAIFATLSPEAKANPRADMLGRRPPLLDPDCRYVYRP